MSVSAAPGPGLMTPPAPSPSLLEQLRSLNVHCEATESDHLRVQELLYNQKANNSRRSSDTFDYKDANNVLSYVAQGHVENTTVGLVQSLLDHGADVNFARYKSTNIFKKAKGQDQFDVRSNVLEQATQNCSSNIVHLLAQNADDIAATQALPAAIKRNDALKAQILLARGADASQMCELFLKAVQTGSNDLVDVLLKDTNGACRDCRNMGLVLAVTHGDVDKVHLLLAKGADVTFDNASALRTALRTGKEAVSVTIASHPALKQHPGLLDAAVGEAYDRKQYRLLKSCLDSGARGPITDTTLAKAVADQHLNVVITLVEHGASAAYNKGKALLNAVASSRPTFLQTVLQGKPPQETLNLAIVQTMMLASMETIYQMVESLLTAGAHGNSVSQALIGALERIPKPGDEGPRLRLIQLLLAKGHADVNFQQGRAIALAVSQGRIDVISMLLHYHPTVESLGTALSVAMDLTSPEVRLPIVKVLINLENNGPVVDDKRNARLRRAAIIAASRSLRLDDLEFLAGFSTSPDDFSAAFAATTTGNDKWLTPQGLEVIYLLLEYEASGVMVDNAFCQAARLHNEGAINMLQDSISPVALNKALADTIASTKSWQSPENYWLIRRLLDWGCNGEPVNTLLLHAVTDFVSGHCSEDLIDTILREPTTADVNYRQGEVLKVAIRGGNAPLLYKLALRGLSREIMTQAFTTAITTPLKEDVVLALLEALLKCSNGTTVPFDVNTPHHDGRPPIVACLMAHPQSPKLVKALVRLGCDLESEFKARLYGEKGIEEEYVTVLLWALRPEGSLKVAAAAIEVLIDAKANVNFTTRISKATPVILAAKYGRGEVMAKLISAKAHLSVRDCFHRSPLFYASRVGDLKAVKELVIAKAKTDDGSLHEAARNLHHRVIDVLIKGKHNVNFPSSAHEGRTALQEMVYSCNGMEDEDRLQDTVQALVNGKAEVLRKHREKNSLFLALDNPQPYRVTLALLDRSMWRDINNEENVFVTMDPKTKVSYHYSATMYLIRGKYTGNQMHVPKLLTLLYEKGCADRYFAVIRPGTDMFQPDDAVGVPTKMAEEDARRRVEEEKRRNKEADHQERLRREDEIQAQKQWHEQRKHSQQIDQSSSAHQLKLYQQAQVAEQQYEAMERKKALTAKRVPVV